MPKAKGKGKSKGKIAMRLKGKKRGKPLRDSLKSFTLSNVRSTCKRAGAYSVSKAAATKLRHFLYNETLREILRLASAHLGASSRGSTFQAIDVEQAVKDFGGFDLVSAVKS
jgi:hypothetical protein